ncbi:hypothetical protein RchiOBHm_Chr5g0070631 [Rosa chinensis]|uniref:Uncharacterized protein n=1 Tax=Rosa chinensis TaxID=74649 RepID=A0A2P6QK81_ROSCH|nr:hypothetical protein RchiOBHm_Chr5g0070631 [Rosa chinensis]
MMEFHIDYLISIHSYNVNAAHPSPSSSPSFLVLRLLKLAEYYDLVGCLLQQLIYLTVLFPLSHFLGKVPSGLSMEESLRNQLEPTKFGGVQRS